MDPCHIAQFLHFVTPQGVRRRDVIDCISCSHLYYLDLQTHPTYYCNHSHRLHTYTYPSVSYEWIQIPWGSDARALQPVAPPVQLKVSRINSYYISVQRSMISLKEEHSKPPYRIKYAQTPLGWWYYSCLAWFHSPSALPTQQIFLLENPVCHNYRGTGVICNYLLLKKAARGFLL